MKRTDKILMVFTALFMVSVFAVAIYTDIKMKKEQETEKPKRSYFSGEKKDWNSNETKPSKRYWLERIYLSEE